MTMPVLFLGHGTPLNAIEDNEYTRYWERLGKEIEERHNPRAILVISAHWESEAHSVTGEEKPRQIYDMYGFPRELYELRYDTVTDPLLAGRIYELTGARTDTSWGIDHGSWSVLCRLFPEGDIPVLQLSINRLATFEAMFAFGELLQPLRDEGVLIMGSGNVVHNLGTLQWGETRGYDHCIRFDQTIRDAVIERNLPLLFHPPLEKDRRLRSFITREHYAPLLYALGATRPGDRVTVFNESFVMGSLSMTSYLFSEPSA